MPKKPQPTLEGFYHYVCNKAVGRQAEVFKYALGRLAKEYPEVNPRVVVLEWLAEHLYAYEEGIGARPYRPERLLVLIEAIKAQADTDSKAKEGTGCADVSGFDGEPG